MAADHSFRIGDHPILFAPGERGQFHIGKIRCVGLADDFGNRDEVASCKRFANEAGVGHGYSRIGTRDPQRLDPSLVHRPEHVDRLEPWLLSYCRRTPKAADCLPLFWHEAEMRSEGGSEPADLAATHRVGLAGNAERPRSLFADATHGEVQIGDGVALVGAANGLVCPLAEQGNRSGEGLDQVG